MIKLSVATITFNEEENIARCLESVRQSSTLSAQTEGLADEMVVVDGSSTDKTVEIARSLGAKVIVTDNPLIFDLNKQKAIEACSGDWILVLDADEVVPAELGREIKRVIKEESQFSAFFIKRKNYFLGRWLTKGGQYPDPVIRLFKRGKASVVGSDLHQQLKVEGEVGRLKNDMLHFSAPRFWRYLTNSNRYTTVNAQKLKEENLKLNLLNHLNYFLLKPFKTFFNIYFRHKGFMDGFPGFVFALFSGLHFPLAYIKYWELTRGE